MEKVSQRVFEKFTNCSSSSSEKTPPEPWKAGAGMRDQYPKLKFREPMGAASPVE